jgi:hypothetical protein
MRRVCRWQSLLSSSGGAAKEDSQFSIGTSKYGGIPDLPAHLPTPFDHIPSAHPCKQSFDMLSALCVLPLLAMTCLYSHDNS